MRRTAPALLLAGSLITGACTGGTVRPGTPAGGAVVVSDEPGALEAMADTLAGSFRWTGRVDLTLDRDEVEVALLRMDEEIEGPLLPEESDDDLVADLDRWEGLARDSSAHGALADDGSWQVAFDHTGQTWLDLRFGLGELLDAQTTTPDATILAQVGWNTLFTMIDDSFEESGDDWDVRDEMRHTATEGPDAGTPFADVLVALADGGWAGLAGTIDLAQFGVAAGDLDAHAQEFRREFAGVADRDTMLALAADAMTVRDYTAADGGLTVATVDLHPRAATFAIYDLFDDATAMVDADPETLPETVEAAAQLTFDEQGRLVEVRTDVLTLAATALEADADRNQKIADGTHTPGPNGWGPEPDVAATSAEQARAAARAIRDLERTSVWVVFAMTDHGQVSTVTDEDAVTMPWGELAESFFGGLYDQSVQEAPPVEEVPEGEQPTAD